MMFAALTHLQANAQFYDSDDEVRIYVSDYVINHPGSSIDAFVMNFNGSKGAVLSSKGSAPSGKSGFMNILDDEFYFEKLIYKEPSSLSIYNYDADKSTNSRVCYSRVSNNQFLQWWGSEKIYSILLFSSDGNHVELSGNDFSGFKDWQRHFTKVSKERLIELILAYHNKKSKSWR